MQRAKQVLHHLEQETTNVEGLPRLARSSTDRRGDELQLSLFQQPDHRLRRRLQCLELDQITPIEALNELVKLRELIDEDS